MLNRFFCSLKNSLSITRRLNQRVISITFPITMMIATFITTPLFAETSDSVLNIEHWQTKNGAEVYFVPTPELPMVDIIIMFRAGSAYDGEFSGLAQLTNQMLAQGTKKLDANQIAEGFDNVGAQFSLSASTDSASLSLRSLTNPELFDPALTLFTEVLTQPTFPKTAFDREKSRVLTAIAQQKQSPSSIANITFGEALYGKHPYATPNIGYEETVNTLTPQQLQKFYQQYYVSKNAVIAIVGDVTQKQAKALSEKLTTHLKKGKQAPITESAKPLTESQTIAIPFPSTQTHVLIGQIGIERTNTDYYALALGNYILGGKPLVSRLFTSVRGDGGFAYSVGSTLKPMLSQGPFVLYLQTQNDQTEAAIDASLTVLKDFLATGLTEDELNAAKQGIIGNFPLSLKNNSAIASVVANLGFYGLPLNYLDTFRDTINNITQEEVSLAFNRMLNSGQLLIVTVGAMNEAKKNQ